MGSAVSLATQWVVASNGAHLLARVSVRDFSHELIYDWFVRPPPTIQVVDYRTDELELNPEDLFGTRAVHFETAQNDVWDLLRGRLLIGHRLWDSLHLLNIRHPLDDTRDLALYLPFQPALNRNAPPLLNIPHPIIVPLADLTQRHLASVHHLPFRNPRENPPDNAEAQMLLYQAARQAWEDCVARGIPTSAPPPNQYRIGEHNYYL
ncbi:hypothetical protein CALVIDRAFT_159908 [Calocera viscosa TUFC12733]|uniref:Exonuclease domain-containing protein n=1 Tax=Calocera viscosa (strain TUFC12733) TaxID=1330018 RepID=A0A167LCE6_CALVF|nr:hypothetical protein CALVIDRAFT_159908 [Calocera viscosa TUFC12733]